METGLGKNNSNPLEGFELQWKKFTVSTTSRWSAYYGSGAAGGRRNIIHFTAQFGCSNAKVLLSI